MGKKDKKKGKGIEKTAAKTEKRLTAKQKKHLAEIGEESIEQIVAKIEEEEKRRLQVKEIVIESPTRRVNFSFAAHPSKDELILFGGEYFNGQKTTVYNDLIFYNIDKNEWTLIQAPGAPPPRCGHQMIALPIDKGQLWVFGGEFTSTSQNQFHHYKDLWVFHIAERRWEKIMSPNGPSARSGHRMTHVKKQLIVFGGYHDNLRDYKYFNDVYAFDLEHYKWSKLEPTGTPPAPRSGCQMVPLPDGKILVQGGYSKEKVKKDVDKGTVHTDMVLLSPEKNDLTNLKWKWVQVKQGGIKISPRSGSTIALAPGGKAYSFGGVFDFEESEEDISGTFYNDLHVLDLEKRIWRTVIVTKKDSSQVKRRRRKDKDTDKENMEGSDVEEEDDGEGDEDGENEEDEKLVTVTDGVFTMTVSRPGTSNNPGTLINEGNSSKQFFPSPRMNCGLAIKRGTLYLYGGMIEDGDKQFTLADMYSLDIHKLDEWKILINDEEAMKEWVASESEDDSDDGMSEDGEGEGDEDEDEEDSEFEHMDTD